MSDDRKKLPTESNDAEIAEFLNRAAALAPLQGGAGKGRLIFALDATASREPTWDQACDIQAEMFDATAELGTLAVQLAYYRGFREFHATQFETNSKALLDRMVRVRCLSGRTQIAKVLRHALAETAREKVNAVVFVGDCCEEDVDELGHMAGELGLHGVPVFMFHEGGEPGAARIFRQIAKLSGGAYCRFDAGSAKLLRELLSAVAVYAVGGRPALANYHQRAGREVLRLPSPTRR